MVSLRLEAMAVKPNSGAAEEEAALLLDGATLARLDELEELDELNELRSLLSSPPQPTKPTPINAATAVPRLPFRNWRRSLRICANVVLLEWLERGSIPELSIS